jgi:hypothetical protein
MHIEDILLAADRRLRDEGWNARVSARPLGTSHVLKLYFPALDRHCAVLVREIDGVDFLFDDAARSAHAEDVSLL